MCFPIAVVHERQLRVDSAISPYYKMAIGLGFRDVSQSGLSHFTNSRGIGTQLGVEYATGIEVSLESWVTDSTFLQSSPQLKPPLKQGV
ncbi:hypothetical protein SCT_1079 [Sulfuricella sp. T08]|nr:hypothetical protein SCT_1079 [Sulfuricella sp. T08]